jgi:hypothetical protein
MTEVLGPDLVDFFYEEGHPIGRDGARDGDERT